MATTVAFDLITQLVAKFATASPDVTVYDGQAPTFDPGNFLMVGVEDPDNTDESSAATGTQDWHGLGAKAALEQGAVTCCALAWSGESGSAAQQSAREAVRDMVKGVDAALLADPNLSGTIPGLNWVRYGSNYTLRQLSGPDGTRAVFYFEVLYHARLV